MSGKSTEPSVEHGDAVVATHRDAIPSTRIIANSYVDERKAQLDELDAKFPDFVHSYEHPEAIVGKRAWEMKVINQEFVKDKTTGDIRHHGPDPVVRQPRKQFEDRLRMQHLDSLEQARSTVKDPEEVKQLVHNAKQPRESVQGNMR